MRNRVPEWPRDLPEALSKNPRHDQHPIPGRKRLADVRWRAARLEVRLADVPGLRVRQVPEYTAEKAPERVAWLQALSERKGHGPHRRQRIHGDRHASGTGGRHRDRCGDENM